MAHAFRCSHIQIYLLNGRLGSFTVILIYHSSSSSSSSVKSSSSMPHFSSFNVFRLHHLVFYRKVSSTLLLITYTCFSIPISAYSNSLLHIFVFLDSFFAISFPKTVKGCEPLTIVLTKLATKNFRFRNI